MNKIGLIEKSAVILILVILSSPVFSENIDIKFTLKADKADTSNAAFNPQVTKVRLESAAGSLPYYQGKGFSCGINAYQTICTIFNVNMDDAKGMDFYLSLSATTGVYATSKLITCPEQRVNSSSLAGTTFIFSQTLGTCQVTISK